MPREADPTPLRNHSAVLPLEFYLPCQTGRRTFRTHGKCDRPRMDSTMKNLITAARLAFVFLFLKFAAWAAPAKCDRTCLVAIMDRYLSAMVKHDPSGLPLAPKYKYTENTATVPLGDGLWVGASEGPTGFKVYAADPGSGRWVSSAP